MAARAITRVGDAAHPAPTSKAVGQEEASDDNPHDAPAPGHRVQQRQPRIEREQFQSTALGRDRQAVARPAEGVTGYSDVYPNTMQQSCRSLGEHPAPGLEHPVLDQREPQRCKYHSGDREAASHEAKHLPPLARCVHQFLLS